MPISQRVLRLAANEFRAQRRSSVDDARRFGERVAFLCHSHKDRTLALGLARQFQAKGITLYIDWLDQEMPDRPNQRTASNLKSKIDVCDFFLFLATENSKSSRWCPWEIGYCDGKRGSALVTIIPTTDGVNSFGNEYLDLYRSIATNVLGEFEVIDPVSNVSRSAKGFFG